MKIYSLGNANLEGLKCYHEEVDETKYWHYLYSYFQLGTPWAVEEDRRYTSSCLKLPLQDVDLPADTET